MLIRIVRRAGAVVMLTATCLLVLNANTQAQAPSATEVAKKPAKKHVRHHGQVQSAPAGSSRSYENTPRDPIPERHDARQGY